MKWYDENGEVVADGKAGDIIFAINELNKYQTSRIEDLAAYADKLAEGLPEGMLPKDIENIRQANVTMATRIAELEATISAYENDLPLLAATEKVRELEAESAALKHAVDDMQSTLVKVETENAALRSACSVANEAYSTVDEWWGKASTKQAAKDSIWRMHQALKSVGYDYVLNNLDWRGSILAELNEAGFYPSCNNPHTADKPDFVYDPDAPNQKRIFGNAIGPTLKEIVAELATLREAQRWRPVGERMPRENQNVEVINSIQDVYTFLFSVRLADTFIARYTHWRPFTPPQEEG